MFSLNDQKCFCIFVEATTAENKMRKFLFVKKIETAETNSLLLEKVKTGLCEVEKANFLKKLVETVEKVETYHLLVDKIETYLN